jgi:hypothetical protein
MGNRTEQDISQKMTYKWPKGTIGKKSTSAITR